MTRGRQPSPEQDTLKKIFLGIDASDLTNVQEDRIFAQEQIRKYLESIDGIESQTFSDHVCQIYDYEDDEITKQKETNFYSRVFEESLESNSITRMPFYYLENTNTSEDSEEKLSDINISTDSSLTISQKERLQDFYKKWNFESQGVRSNIFFSSIPSLNQTSHFPRAFKAIIQIQPTPPPAETTFTKLTSLVSVAEFTEFRTRVYDSMCLKYISMLNDADEGKKYILSSMNSLSTQTSQMFKLNDLIGYDEDNAVFLDESLTIQDMLKINPDSESADVTDYEISLLENVGFYFLLYGIENSVSSSITMRDYDKITTGTPAPSEPFLYEIIKKDSNGRKINSFFFPARLFHSSDQQTNLEFIDTQIRHDEEYHYSLKTHQIIYGEEYRYVEDSSYNQLEVLGADVDIGRSFAVKIVPDYRIASFETAKWSNKTISPPGVSPDVKILPQKNKRGMPKFFLKSNFGKTEIEDLGFRYPILSDQDLYRIPDVIRNYANQDGKVTFESRFQNKFYEIYRIDKAPLTISDFKDSMIAKTLPSYSDHTGFNPSSIYEDNIQSNKKYYYLFRAVDIWGTPTAITGPFEYEILEDSGSFTVNFKPYDFDYPLEKINMGMRKLMKVTPNWRHTRIPEESLGDLKSAFSQVGNKDAVQYIKDEMQSGSTFWDKKYKIRVVSKKTGRKIDIIFTPRLTRG